MGLKVSEHPAVRPIRLGTCKTYLIEGTGGIVLVDAGNRGCQKAFFNGLAKWGLSPDDVRLIVVTHVHFDHVGSLRAIRDACRCPVAVHESESSLLASGQVVIPPGVTRLTRAASSLGRAVGPRLFRFESVEPDILVQKSFDLTEFGLIGSLVSTPGHTEGSISLLLDDGRAFIGDVAVNPWPFDWGKIFPPFAEDAGRLLETWFQLLTSGARYFYPAHGQPFSARRLIRAYRKRCNGRGGQSWPDHGFRKDRN